MILTNYESHPAFCQMVSFMVVPKYARHVGFVTVQPGGELYSQNRENKKSFGAIYPPKDFFQINTCHRF